MSDHMVELDEGEVMPARKRPDSGDLDITPMIDITFLLLIFFIVTSNLDQQSAAKMPTAENGTSVATSKSAVLTVTPGGSEGRALVYLGDGVSAEMMTSDNDLNRQEEQIADYIEGLFSGKADGGVPKVHLLVKADGKVASGEVNRVMLAALRTGAVEEVDRVFIGTEYQKK